jgi:hypothetical protein
MTTRNTPETQHPRLPCRGCTPDCRNYAVCEGAPWRIARDGTLSAPIHRSPVPERR